MMGRANPQLPVRRRRVLIGTAIALAAFAGIVGLAEGLRQPLPGAGSPTAPQRPMSDTDPRLPPACPGPPPNEQRDRPSEATLRPVEAPVEVTSEQLLDCPESFTRRTVRYQGEAVGGVLRRDDGAWVHVNDDAYAGPIDQTPARREHHGGNAGIGVFLPLELADRISTVGGPQTRGDLIEVVGVFSRVHPSSREVAVVHAESLELVRSGGRFSDPPLRDRQVAAGVLALLAAAAAVTERVVARRRMRL